MSFVIEIVNCIVELLIVLFFFNQTLNGANMARLKRYSITAGILAFHIFRSFLILPVYVNFGVSAIVVGSCAAFLYDGHPIKKLGMVLLYFVVLISTDALARSILAALMGVPNSFNGYTDIERYVGMTLCTILNLSILAFLSTFAKKRLNNVGLRYWVMMVLFPIFSLFIVICCDFLIIRSGTNDISYIALMTFIIIGLLYFNATVFEFIDTYSAKIQLEGAKELIKYQEENYKMLEINERELRKLRHDINSHIEVIKMLVEKHDLSEVAELTKSIENLSALPANITYTNDSTLDSVLNINCKKAAEAGIKYTVTTASMRSPIYFSAIDKSTILSNAITNAVEASSLSDEKFIIIDIASDAKSVRITIENSSLPPKSGGFTSTTKSDRLNHGFGIESIRLALKKYGGSVKMSYDNGVAKCIITASQSA